MARHERHTRARSPSAGEKLFNDLSCNTCHRPETQGRGPSLHGLVGRTVALEGGDTVVADEAYVRESIVNPSGRITAGYQPVMPAYQGLVSEEGLLALVEYVKSLGEASGTSHAQ